MSVSGGHAGRNRLTRRFVLIIVTLCQERGWTALFGALRIRIESSGPLVASTNSHRTASPAPPGPANQSGEHGAPGDALHAALIPLLQRRRPSSPVAGRERRRSRCSSPPSSPEDSGVKGAGRSWPRPSASTGLSMLIVAIFGADRRAALARLSLQALGGFLAQVDRSATRAAAP
jgi:hypothetical protein